MSSLFLNPYASVHALQKHIVVLVMIKCRISVQVGLYQQLRQNSAA